MKAATQHPAAGSVTFSKPAFDLGHEDGYGDATRNDPCDPAARFAAWHRLRDVSDFADYELGYRASYAQVKAAVA